MERSVLRVRVSQLSVDRQQVDIVHGDIVELVLGVLEADVDQGRTIEAEPIDLVHDEDLVPDVLVVEELRHVRHELEQFVKAIAERHDHGKRFEVAVAGQMRTGIGRWMVSFEVVGAVAVGSFRLVWNERRTGGLSTTVHVCP